MAATDTASPSPIPAPRPGFPPASPMPPASPIPDPSPMPKGISAGRTRTKDEEMMISSVVRDRASGSAASAGAAEFSGGDAQANSADEAQLPFAGYERLDARQAKEIKRVRGYERKSGNRARVVDEVVRVHRTRGAMQPASNLRAPRPVTSG